MFTEARKKMDASFHHFWKRTGRDLNNVERQIIHPYGHNIGKRKHTKVENFIDQASPLVIEKPISHESK